MRPLVYAHRGSHLCGLRENTPHAFAEAVSMGADGIETDLRETADGCIALYHDDIAGGRPVEEMTLRGPREAAGFKVPTLEEALGMALGTRWNLEVKTTAAWTLLEPLAAHLPGGTMVTSFIHAIPDRCARACGIDAGLLTASSCDRAPPAVHPHLHTCVWDSRVLDVEHAASWHAEGWDLATYGTVGEVRHRRAMSLRPSIVITDEVELALRLAHQIPS